MLYSYHFLTFRVFHTLVTCFLLVDQKMVYRQLIHLILGFLSMTCNTYQNNFL